jgi:hypothetical protein
LREFKERVMKEGGLKRREKSGKKEEKCKELKKEVVE